MVKGFSFAASYLYVLNWIVLSFFLVDEVQPKKAQGMNVRELTVKRNKVMLGLILFQALDTTDMKALTVNDVKLREGKIFVPGNRRTNEREMKLEAMQVLELMEYIHATRQDLLRFSGKTTDQLFTSIGSGDRIHNLMSGLIKNLHAISHKVASLRQIHASVIVQWLKRYNLRQVQYMAGHRYVSSTEAFLANEMQQMIEDIEKFHPIG